MLPTWVFTVASATNSAAGDLRVRRATGHQAQDVVLTVGEQVEPGRVTGGGSDHAAVAVEHARRDRGVEPGSASGDRADRRDQVLRGAVLEHEPGGARLDRAPQHLVLAEGREHEDVERILEATQLRGRGDAVEDRHADVHEDDVRAEGAAARRPPAGRPRTRRRPRTRPRARGCAPGRRGRWPGRRRERLGSLAPPFSPAAAGSSPASRRGVGPASSSPPSAVARSCIPISP